MSKRYLNKDNENERDGYEDAPPKKRHQPNHNKDFNFDNFNTQSNDLGLSQSMGYGAGQINMANMMSNVMQLNPDLDRLNSKSKEKENANEKEKDKDKDKDKEKEKEKEKENDCVNSRNLIENREEEDEVNVNELWANSNDNDNNNKMNEKRAASNAKLMDSSKLEKDNENEEKERRLPYGVASPMRANMRESIYEANNRKEKEKQVKMGFDIEAARRRARQEEAEWEQMAPNNKKMFVDCRHLDFACILDKLGAADGNGKAILWTCGEQYVIQHGQLELLKLDIEKHEKINPQMKQAELPIVIVLHDTTVSGCGMDKRWMKNLLQAINKPRYKEVFQCKFVKYDGIIDWSQNYKEKYLPAILEEHGKAKSSQIRIIMRNIGSSYNEHGRNSGTFSNFHSRSKYASQIWDDSNNGIKHLIQEHHALVHITGWTFRHGNKWHHIGGPLLFSHLPYMHIDLIYDRAPNYTKEKLSVNEYCVSAYINKASYSILQNENQFPLKLNCVSNADKQTLTIDWIKMDSQYNQFQHCWSRICKHAEKKYDRLS